MLAYEVYVTTTSANVGVHWSHDLGGFDPDKDRTGPPAGTGGRLPLKPLPGSVGGMRPSGLAFATWGGAGSRPLALLSANANQTSNAIHARANPWHCQKTPDSGASPV